MKSYFSLYNILGFILAVCCILTLTMGDTPWPVVWQGAVARLTGESSQWNPLLDERLPRLIVVLCTGSSLAVSGAVMQALFQNPLASPSVLGISCGGSLMVVLVFIFGWHLEYPYAVPLAAVGGSLLALLLIFFLARNNQGAPLTTLILTGIALSTLLIAIQGALMYALRDHWHLIQTLTEWEAGSTTDRSWKHVHMQLPLTIVGLAGCWLYRYEIDILALGEEEATNLGVEVEKVRWRLFLCVSLLTGGAIAAVGIIAFFGLVLPHVVRRLQGPNSRQLIPLCIISGSIALAAMDLLLRMFSIHSFSIGNVSAILGGLFFMILLFGSRQKHQENYSTQRG
jgi:iron complex transport system permease protein